MRKLHCDMCGEWISAGYATKENFVSFNDDDNLIFYLCPKCFNDEYIRYFNCRISTSDALRIKGDTKNNKSENK